MAKPIFKPWMVATASQLSQIAEVPGQLIVVQDTGKIYVDIVPTGRIQINSDVVKNISVSGKTITITKADGTTSTYDVTYSPATQTSNGLMSADDKKKLDGVAANANNYSLPVAGTSLGGIRSGTDISVDSSGNVSVVDNSHNHTIGNVTSLQDTLDSKVPTSRTVNGKALTSNISLNASDVGAIGTNKIGVASGVASLGTDGKIPSSQLPSYVDDVIEGYLSGGNFYSDSALKNKITGETGKIYIDLNTSKTYRWGGSAFAVISETLALGETSSTAFRGDHGKVAYDHANAKGSAFASGLYKITTNAQGHVTAATAVAKSDITNLGIPATNTDTWKANTASSEGYVAAGTGHANQVWKTDANGVPGWRPDADTKYAAMTGATAENNGVAGLAPAPDKGAANRYLRSDGTWQVPPDNNTTYGVATQSGNGLMSAADKTKLDGIASGANNYSLPLAATGTRGGVKIGYTSSGKNYAVQLSDEKMYVNVPWTDTTYSDATTSSHGLMTAAMVTKLNGIAAGANAYTLPVAGTALGGVKSGTDISVDTAGNVSVVNDSHTHSNSTITSLDASKITSGTIDIARLPEGALERMIVVANATDRKKLKPSQAQKGDTVKQIDTGVMYFVVDDTKLDSDAGYEVYTAGAATSVPWSGITNKPNLAGSSTMGGSATSAVKLDTATAGSATQPVYFTGGKPTACTYTLGKSVPSNAVFTDTTYNIATQSSSGLISATDKKVMDAIGGQTNLGSFTDKTIGDLQTALLNWIQQYKNIPHATVCFTANYNWIDLWNADNTTGKITAGVTWTASVIAKYSDSNYIQLRISTYSSESVYQLHRSSGKWGKVIKFATANLATQSAPGLMSAADKTLLDGLSSRIAALETWKTDTLNGSTAILKQK